jgi:hypothetical protein
VFNFFAIFYQKKLLARKTPKPKKVKILMIFVKNSITQLKRVVIKIDGWSHLSFN